MRRASLLLAAFTLLRAQSPPDAAALLERSTHAFDGFRGYEFEFRSTDLISATVTGNSAGKMRVEDRLSGLEQTLVYDGETLWSYHPRFNNYTRGAWRGGSFYTGSKSTMIEEGLAVTRTVVREETLTVDGLPHECWVVERDATVPWPNSSVRRTTAEVKETTWIDKQLWIQWQRIIDSKPAPGGAPVDVPAHTVETRTNLKVNADIPDSFFTFTPPEGAQEEFVGSHVH